MNKHKTREEWLESAVEQMRPLFKNNGYTIPPLRVACGWPVRGGMANKKRVLGECWDKKAAADKKLPQIFISPWLADPMGDCGVLATLVHEVVHGVVGNQEKHNKVFGKCARAVGLGGKLTSIHAEPALVEAFKNWVAKLGEYPHSQLSGLKEPGKKQTTRLIKCKCPKCGYVCRSTMKWLDAAGAPLCPTHGKAMEFEAPEE